MAIIENHIQNPIPEGYITPPFPSLYWPFQPIYGKPSYLYRTGDAWRFTFLWTLIVYAAIHLTTSGYAVTMQPKNWRMAWAIPLVYCVVGGIEAMLAGSVVGLILGAVYAAGSFRLSTWIPFAWSLINGLVLILSSFSIQGGM